MSAHLTPYNDAYGTCKQCYATLRIYSDDLTPEEISIVLGVSPTEWIGKGRLNEFTAPGRAPRLSRTNAWIWSTKKNVDLRDLRRHLDTLIEAISGHEDGLKKLQSKKGVRMGVTCSWWSNFNEGGPAIWPEQLAALAAHCLELNFEFSFFEDDEEAFDDN